MLVARREGCRKVSVCSPKVLGSSCTRSKNIFALYPQERTHIGSGVENQITVIDIHRSNGEVRAYVRVR